MFSSRIILSSAALLFYLLPGAALAESVSPILLSEESRSFPGPGSNLAEKTAPIRGKGSSLNIAYTSDAEVELRISFLIESEGGGTKYNPLHTIKFPDVTAGEVRQVTLNLTKSPAWSNKTQDYLLHVWGPVGANVVIHDIEFEDASMADVLGAAFGQLFTDEAVQLSTGNYRWGYRVLNISVTAVLGVILLLAISFWLLVTSFWFRRNQRLEVGDILRAAILVSLIFILLYDVRFSLDLVRTSARDISSWTGDGEYRQLGPVNKIVGDLKNEQMQFGDRMRVTLCTDLEDLYFKHIRYHMYPVKVDQGENWSEATHVVFIGKHHSVQPGGMITCRADQASRRIDIIDNYEEGSALYRFSNIPPSP